MQAAVKPLRIVKDPPGELETLYRAHSGRIFRTAPPPPDWNGIHIATEK